MINPLMAYEFNPNYSWEYNLIRLVRWNSPEVKDDVCFYINAWLEDIAKQEGYKLVKE